MKSDSIVSETAFWQGFSLAEDREGAGAADDGGAGRHDDNPTAVHEGENIRLAARLAAEKNKLIAAVARFPIAALWLLYDRQEDPAQAGELGARSRNDGGRPAPPPQAALETCLSAACRAFLNDDDAEACRRACQDLRSELSRAAYSFEDLQGIVDLIALAYRCRNASFQAGRQPNARAAGRIDSAVRRSPAGAEPAADSRAPMTAASRAANYEDYEDVFLFLSTSELNAGFHELIGLEQSWLAYRQRIILINSKLVWFIARQYRSTFLAIDDLVQEGQIGLMKAIDKFDYQLGFQFSTYAGYWIRQTISRAVSRLERTVRVPCGQNGNINKIFRARDELSAKKGAEIACKDLAAYTGFELEEIYDLLAVSQSALALEKTDSDEPKELAPIDYLEQEMFVHPINTIAKLQLTKVFAESLKTLSEREACILRWRFGFGSDNEITLQDIGAKLNLTRERVRQIQNKALAKLKQRYAPQLCSLRKGFC